MTACHHSTQVVQLYHRVIQVKLKPKNVTGVLYRRSVHGHHQVRVEEFVEGGVLTTGSQHHVVVLVSYSFHIHALSLSLNNWANLK